MPVPEELVEELIEGWLAKGASYVECRSEVEKRTVIEVKDREVRRLDFGISAGLALRALVEGKTHFITFSLDEADGLKVRSEEVMPDKPWITRSSLAEAEPVKDEVRIRPAKPNTASSAIPFLLHLFIGAHPLMNSPYFVHFSQGPSSSHFPSCFLKS